MNDKVIDTLHANAEIGMAKMEYEYLWYNYMLNSLSGSSSFSVTYTWFVDMTFTKWDYKWNSDWQVGHKLDAYVNFNNLNMNINNNWNWQPWIYFEGNIWGADQIGNMNLAYVRYMMGFGQTFLTDNFDTRDDVRDGKALDMGFLLARSGR